MRGLEGHHHHHQFRRWHGTRGGLCSLARALAGAGGMGTCGGSVLGLEEAHDALSVQPPRAQQHGLGAGVPPAHHGEAVLAVAAGDPLDRVVLDALRHDEQPGVAAGESGGSAEPGAAPDEPPTPRQAPRSPPGPAEAHLRQMAYMRFTVEMRKGSFLERVRLLLRVPSPRRW